MSEAPTFWIYVTLHPEPRARIHYGTCRCVQGRRITTQADNWWAHAFGTLNDAHVAAQRMLSGSGPVIDKCVNCIGPD